jgi:hypothetical protein
LRSACLSVEGCCVPAAVGVGFGDGLAARALTAPTLSSAATPAALIALTATAANGVIFVLTSDKICEVENRALLSDAGCDHVRFL